jgi:AcrR family transcriptional regulator
MTTFQRARRPEQVAARRAAILAAAAEMLRERQVADISLRELADRVGLAKSNVVRYFDSREAIFLEVLDQTWTAWLDDLDLNPGEDDRPYARETRVGTAVAASLVERPLLCDLFAAMAAVLERNISLDVARDVKRRFSANTARLAGLVRAAVPVLDDAGATHFAGAVVVLVAGLAPHATPTETVVAACTELGLPCGPDLFAMGLTEGLVNQLVGLAVRARTR